MKKELQPIMKLKDLPKGEYFTRKPYEYPTESQVFVRDDYNRFSKKYNCYKFDDVNHYVELKGDTLVYTCMYFTF